MQVKFKQEFCVHKWLQRSIEKRLTALAAFLGAPWGQGKHKRWAGVIVRLLYIARLAPSAGER